MTIRPEPAGCMGGKSRILVEMESHGENAGLRLRRAAVDATGDRECTTWIRFRSLEERTEYVKDMASK